MRKIRSKKEWKKRRNQKKLLIFGLLFFIALMAGMSARKYWNDFRTRQAVSSEGYIITPGTVLKGDYPKKLDIDVQLLTPNPYSRPQTPLEKVNGVVIHYTANPGTDALANRNYFEGLKDGKGTSASSHFIIGLEGNLVQCIPTKEVAYASNERNEDTISVECCYTLENGKFNPKTYDKLVELTAWICCQFNLSENDIIRHYDITGKNCPKYFVEHEEEWKRFKKDVVQFIEENKVE